MNVILFFFKLCGEHRNLTTVYRRLRQMCIRYKNDPENVDEIKELLKTILADKDKQKAAIDHNSKKIKPFLEREYITQQVLKKYKVIEDELISTYD